ncbi:sulfonate transport system permease protein [Microbacterium endophyticum]|uniref:Sulfonate transport system permease protein n=1 Tax=Microbacterium endophyticum TaxID=1526412 RepID=A0A7W4V553_9MICO|nr:ABC transporter permease [Microbacterium endophyticum]MBB2977038.1 sulfonate transport system permease protein [Microbacterium endophyticum]NIK36676.1 sulfonate transport system permease protein [Microbacterium endophyticum]
MTLLRGNTTVGAASVPFWRRRSVRVSGGLLVPILILGVWQTVTVSGLVPSYRLPAPTSVLAAAIQLSESGELWFHVAISVQRVLLGFGIGSAVGLVFAALVGLTRVGDILFTPILAAFRAVPSLALVPLLLLWMGIGEDSKVILIAIGAFFPVFTTVSSALRQVDPQSIEMARSFSLRGLALFRVVQLPAVVPSIVSGLRLAMAQSWLFLVAAELLAAAMGLGFLLTLAQSTGRIDQILLAIVLLAVLGTLSNAMLSLAQKYLLQRWI